MHGVDTQGASLSGKYIAFCTWFLSYLGLYVKLARAGSYVIGLLKCIHSGQLILKKISKIGAIKCQILNLKCTEFDFGWVTPQTPLGSLQCFPAGAREPCGHGGQMTPPEIYMGGQTWYSDPKIFIGKICFLVHMPTRCYWGCIISILYSKTRSRTVFCYHL